VAIVGSTVRDLLGGKSGKDIVDIDMTISQTYATLGFALTDGSSTVAVGR
jgi:tRNA nucleotidyltransferase/poly(A) polymerase